MSQGSEWRKNALGKIATVTGNIAPEELGVTITHEHLLSNLTSAWHEPTIYDPVRREQLARLPVSMELVGEINLSPINTVRDNLLLESVDLATSEAMEYKLAGGNSIVELTNIGLGRDPSGLQVISRRTGLNIIEGCGFYTKQAHPDYVGQKLVDELAEKIVDDITNGVDGTNVKAGVIGEIGLSGPTMHPDEEKVLHAACRAQRKTGVGISLHCGFSSVEESMKVLDIVEKEGCSPERIIFGHQDGYGNKNGVPNVELHKELARHKAYVQYDLFGREGLRFLNYNVFQLPSDLNRIDAIRQLIDSGYLSNVLISQDVCQKVHLRRYGANGYSHILRNLIPAFKARGFKDEEINGMLIENPRRVLAISST